MSAKTCLIKGSERILLNCTSQSSKHRSKQKPGEACLAAPEPCRRGSRRQGLAMKRCFVSWPRREGEGVNWRKEWGSGGRSSPCPTEDGRLSTPALVFTGQAGAGAAIAKRTGAWRPAKSERGSHFLKLVSLETPPERAREGGGGACGGSPAPEAAPSAAGRTHKARSTIQQSAAKRALERQ